MSRSAAYTLCTVKKNGFQNHTEERERIKAATAIVALSGSPLSAVKSIRALSTVTRATKSTPFGRSIQEAQLQANAL